MLTEADLAKLAALVERCRVASADLEIARECGDQDYREGALGERDASERRLGAEWRVVGELVAGAQNRERLGLRCRREETVDRESRR